MATIYARLINQYKIKYHTLSSASFHKCNEEDQRNEEFEIFIDLNINHDLTETDINNIDVKYHLEHQVQIQETKENGWIFDKIKLMKKEFFKTGEINGSSYVKTPIRSTAILKMDINDKYSFQWSILPFIHPCENSHQSRVTNVKTIF